MAPDRIAGRYRVERAAGHGGMGTVWLCVDEVLGRRVAVKEVGTLPGQTTLDLARALREARSSAALNHRNVVSVYDAVEEGDRIWLVMEYVEGRTLAEILEQDGPLTPAQAAHVGAQVAAGLAAAHARGTIHRDVKPGNILVGPDGAAKISDFGIARTTGDAQVTRTGMVIGTPTYFAPELARGAEPTPAADVWALGATLYTAVEGRTPYPEQPNALAMLNEIAQRQPPLPQQAGFLTEPISRSLDPDPRSRWSMADLAHVLQRLDQRNSSGRTQAVTAAIPGAADGGSARSAYVPLNESSREPAPEPEQPPTGPGRDRRGGRLILVGLVALLVLGVAGGFLLLGDLDDPPTDEASPSSAESPREGRRTNRSSATSQPTPTEGAVESDTPTTTPIDTPTATPTASEPVASPATGGGPEQFVSDYYGALPTDTDTGWSSLSPGMQDRIGFDSYRGFWNTVADVVVTGTRPGGGGAVDVSLTYTHQDGSTEDEVRRIVVERSGEGYLIAGDEVIG